MIGYNRMTGYNVARYNGDGSELASTDTVTVVDVTVTKTGRKTFSALVTISESITKQQNKSVTDTTRLDEWTRYSIDQAQLWGD